jgi:hypothetical protein
MFDPQVLFRAANFIGISSTQLIVPHKLNVLRGSYKGNEVILKRETLEDMPDIIRKLDNIKQLRSVGVPCSLPLEIAVVEDCIYTIWEFIARKPGTPPASSVQTSFKLLHSQIPSNTFDNCFGNMANIICAKESLAHYREPIEKLEAYIVEKFPQTSVIHNDALSANLIYGLDEKVWFIDFEHLSIGNPLIDWQCLARENRLHNLETARVEWYLPIKEIEQIGDPNILEPGWESKTHELWRARGLGYISRKIRQESRGIVDIDWSDAKAERLIRIATGAN